MPQAVDNFQIAAVCSNINYDLQNVLRNIWYLG